jgi:hypothetical protein
VHPVLGALPLHFEANRGQASREVRFLACERRSLLHLDSRAGLTLRRRGDSFLRVELSGANPAPQVVGQSGLPGKSHYFIGNDPVKWITDVPHYAQVRYREVYPHTDLVYYGKADRLEYDFVVGPGADPRVIRLRFSGQRRLTVDPGGNLVLDLGREQIRQPRPRVYQKIKGTQVELAGGYVPHGANEVGFETGPYDPSQPLVIDPVLEYSTHLGGTGKDEGRGIAVDGLGFAYVTGTTSSPDFPSLHASAGDFNWNAFVTKLAPTGNAIVYSAFIGGATNDVGTGIVVDSSGNVYASGYTISKDFPVTANAFQRKAGGQYDAYVVKLDPSGSRLLYSTLLGSTFHDYATSLAVDRTGAAYVTGYTQGGSPYRRN